MERTRLRKTNRQRRDEAIAARFTALYEVERIRLDDCIAKLAEEFFLSPKTIESILSRNK